MGCLVYRANSRLVPPSPPSTPGKILPGTSVPDEDKIELGFGAWNYRHRDQSGSEVRPDRKTNSLFSSRAYLELEVIMAGGAFHGE